MKVIELDQGGPVWLQWRKTGIGSSDAAVIAGALPSCFSDEIDLIQTKLGLREEPENEAMARGKRLESRARQLYELLHGYRMTPVCVVHDSIPWLKASLDGLSDGQDLILEIKCPGDGVFGKILESRQPPDYYYPQMQHQMLVTGVKMVHFWAFTDSETFDIHNRYVRVEVPANPEYQTWLLEKERKFMEKLTVPGKLSL